MYQVGFLFFYYPEYYLYNNLFPFGNTIDKIIINDHGAGSTDALNYAVKKYGRRPIVYSYPIYSEYLGATGKQVPYFSFQPLEQAIQITDKLYGKAKPIVVVYQNHLLLRDAEGNREKLNKYFKRVYDVKYGNFTTASVWEEKN